MRFPSVTLRLPGWVGGLILDPDRTYPNAEDRTRLAVELSREGSHRGKGDLSEQRSSTGRRTSSSPPVPRPRCKPRSCPGLLLRPREDGGDHGHPPARWGLRPGRGGAATLRAASTEPCSMCFGAVPWFGVRHLVRGARGEDAEAAGFDKGPKPAEWVRTLEEPGITVERDVLRNEAAAVLRETAKKAARSTSTTATRVARAETPWGMLSGCGSHTLSPRRGPRCGRRLPLVRRGRALPSPRPPGPAPRRP
jgi:hypothetical protein